MADEITLTFGLSMLKATAGQVDRNPDQQSVTMTGTDFVHNTQNIATSAEALAKGDITTPGYCMFHNLDGTNYVEIGYDDTGFKPTVRLNAGEWAMFRCTQAAPQAQANTAAVNLEYIILEA